MEQYIAAALARCDEVEQRIPELMQLAELVAKRHAAGGALRVIWEGSKGGLGPQGPQNELLGRSGGMGGDDLAVNLSGGGRAGRLNMLVNVLNSWAFVGELFAALTREGRTPTMLTSHSLPG